MMKFHFIGVMANGVKFDLHGVTKIETVWETWNGKPIQLVKVHGDEKKAWECRTWAGDGLLSISLFQKIEE
jgi:hypothetical protein